MDEEWLKFSKELHEDLHCSYMDLTAWMSDTMGARAGSWMICLPLSQL